MHVAVIELDGDITQQALAEYARKLTQRYPVFHAREGTRRDGTVPVLRLSVLTDEGSEKARNMLTDMLAREGQLLLPTRDALAITPLGKGRIPDIPRDIKAQLQAMAGPTAGAIWQTANLLQAYHAHQTKDFGKLSLSGLYFVSNLITMFYTGKAYHQTVDQLIDTVEDSLVREGVVEPGELDANRQTLKDIAGEIDHFLRRHPWEAAGLMQFTGALSLLGSALFGKHRAMPRTVSALAAVAATTLQALVPQESGRSLMASLNIKENAENLPGQFVLRPLIQTADSFNAVTTRFGEWLRPNKHKAVAGLHIVNNLGLLVSSLTDKHQASAKTQILATTLTFLGYGLQTMVKDPELVKLDKGDQEFVIATYIHRRFGDVKLGAKALAEHISQVLEQEVPGERCPDPQQSRERNTSFANAVMEHLQAMQRTPATGLA